METPMWWGRRTCGVTSVEQESVRNEGVPVPSYCGCLCCVTVGGRALGLNFYHCCSSWRGVAAGKVGGEGEGEAAGDCRYQKEG